MEHSHPAKYHSLYPGRGVVFLLLFYFIFIALYILGNIRTLVKHELKEKKFRQLQFPKILEKSFFVTSYFSLAFLKILFLTFDHLIIMCLSVDHCWGLLHQIWDFCGYYLFKYFFFPLFSLFSFWESHHSYVDLLYSGL